MARKATTGKQRMQLCYAELCGPGELERPYSKRDNCITSWITLINDWSWMAWRASGLREPWRQLYYVNLWLNRQESLRRESGGDHCVILHYDYVARKAGYMGRQVDSCILLMQIKPWKRWKQLSYAYMAGKPTSYKCGPENRWRNCIIFWYFCFNGCGAFGLGTVLDQHLHLWCRSRYTLLFRRPCSVGSIWLRKGN